MTIAVLGGTGPEGLGIAARLAAAGEDVVLGSRDAERAASAAAALAPQLAPHVPGARLRGLANAKAAATARLVVIAVPAAGVAGLLEECGPALAGKLVLDVVNAVRMERGIFRASALPEGSIGGLIAARVPGSRVVSGLKHESAANLRALGRRLEGDVLLCGDDADAKRAVAGLVRRIPDLRPVDAGGLAVAPLLDQVTALLLNLNRRHGAETSLRIIGLAHEIPPEGPQPGPKKGPTTAC